MNPMMDCQFRLGSARLNRHVPMSRPPLSPAYRVGELFRSTRRSWPAATEYSCGLSGHELTLFRPDVTPRMVEDVRRGQAEFALVVEPPILAFAYRFGESIPWSDVPYCWNLQPASRRVIPAREPLRESRTLLWVTLVDCNDGVIHAQRGLTLSSEFSGSLHEAIRGQAMRTLDPHQCMSAVGSVFVERTSVEDRLDRASARTLGNA